LKKENVVFEKEKGALESEKVKYFGIKFESYKATLNGSFKGVLFSFNNVIHQQI
jgi:hypothetical protein